MLTFHLHSARQLFLDDALIDTWDGFTLVMNPPAKAAPAVVSDRPWESHRVGAYGTVIEDEGLFKMWYDAIALGADGSHDSVFLCYATSTDGVHWDKPELGLVEFEGSTANNIIPIMACGTPFVDPVAPPDKRFKYVTTHWKHGMFTYFSPDGLHWTMNPELSLPLDCDTQNQALYDDRIGKYVAYLRGWNPLRVVVRAEMDDILAPWPYEHIEKPFYIWGEQQAPTPSLELPTVIACDENDPPDTDLYTPSVVKYPWAENAYFAFPSPYRHYPDPPVGKLYNDGPVDLQMAVSRDGITWQRPDRRPYVSRGLAGSLDCGSMYMLVGMIRRGEDIYQYYCGFDQTHGEGDLAHDERKGAIIRTVQRLDGFMSADAAYTGATLTTKPLTFTGNHLELNLDLGALGTAKVAILDETGAPIPGFTVEDCDCIEGNHTAKTVTWQGQSDLSALKDRPVRMHIAMRAGKLFAMQFAE